MDRSRWETREYCRGEKSLVEKRLQACRDEHPDAKVELWECRATPIDAGAEQEEWARIVYFVPRESIANQ